MTGPVIFLLTLAAKGGVLLLIAFGAAHALGGAPAELRRRVWLTTLVGLLLLPLLTATLPGWQILPFPAAPGVVFGEVEFGMGSEQRCPGLQ